MKKLSVLLVMVLILTLLLPGCEKIKTDTEKSDAPKVIKIGVYEPASGKNEAGGKQETLGIRYANSVSPTVEINGEEYTVELVSVDNESSEEKAAGTAYELIEQGVSVVIGSYGSEVTVAAADTFEEAAMPVICATATASEVTDENDNCYRICYRDSFQAKILAEVARNELGAKTASCIAEEGDEDSISLCESFKQEFEALGGNVIYEVCSEGSTDFSSYVTNARKARADLLFAPVSTETGTYIIKEVDNQSLIKPVLSGSSWDTNVITNVANHKNAEVFVTTFCQAGSDADFYKACRKWIKSDSERVYENGGKATVTSPVVMGYDAYFVALEAIKLAGSTGSADILKALHKVDYKGVSGQIKFNQNGDAYRDVAYLKKCNTDTGSWEFMSERRLESDSTDQ